MLIVALLLVPFFGLSPFGVAEVARGRIAIYLRFSAHRHRPFRAIQAHV
jgi:hypothetical protein